MIRPTLVLFIICLVVGAAMAFTNAATSEKIAQRAVEDSEKAKKSVLPEADSFTGIDLKKLQESSKNADYGTIKEAYAGKKAGKAIGYVFLAKPTGYAGEISVMIGISMDGSVTGIEIGDNKETPGLGSKAKDREFKDQYYNKKFDIINVVKHKPQKDDEVQAISGATITSKGVSLGVQQASRLARVLLENQSEVK
jgi:electron transport complex, RnfABCDGE type, G subunit